MAVVPRVDGVVCSKASCFFHAETTGRVLETTATDVIPSLGGVTARFSLFFGFCVIGTPPPPALATRVAFAVGGIRALLFVPPHLCGKMRLLVTALVCGPVSPHRTVCLGNKSMRRVEWMFTLG